MPFEVHEHYNCRISDVTTNHERITPTWHRVSQSPWAAKSEKTAGYGRPIMRCAVSDDLPLHFVRTEHIKRPEDLKALPKQDFSGTASIQASLVLPGAGSTLAPKPKHGNRIKKLIHGNQILVEPYNTARDRAAFCKWNSDEPRSNSSTARCIDTGRIARRPATSHGVSQAFPPSSRIASARSTGRRDGSASNRALLFSR